MAQPIRRRGMLPRGGFTMIEIIIVLVIVAVMLGIGAGALNKAADSRSVASARDSYIWMARRAQATAIQKGTTVKLSLVRSTARANMVAGGTLLQSLWLRKEYGTTLTLTSGDSILVCYSPRGTSTPGCSSTLPNTATFKRGVQSAKATVQYLGQVQAQ